MSPSNENGVHVNGSDETIKANGTSTNVQHQHTEANSTSTAYGPTTFDLTRVLRVLRSPKAFSSYAISLVSLPAGSTFAPILGTTPAVKAYSTVQTGRASHIELNSELLYCNHSCAPTVEFDVKEMVVRVARDRDLKEGDLVTFWYPSTEWSMSQRFECFCGAEGCKGWISGAGEMEEGVVREYWLNEHIEELLEEKKSKLAGENGVSNGVANGVSNGH